ncbi:MAG: geobacillin-26 family protein [Acinetobacter sp.]
MKKKFLSLMLSMCMLITSSVGVVSASEKNSNNDSSFQISVNNQSVKVSILEDNDSVKKSKVVTDDETVITTLDKKNRTISTEIRNNYSNKVDNKYIDLNVMNNINYNGPESTVTPFMYQEIAKNSVKQNGLHYTKAKVGTNSFKWYVQNSKSASKTRTVTGWSNPLESFKNNVDGAVNTMNKMNKQLGYGITAELLTAAAGITAVNVVAGIVATIVVGTTAASIAVSATIDFNQYVKDADSIFANHI